MSSFYDWTTQPFATNKPHAFYYLAKFSKLRKRVALMRSGHVAEAVAYFTSEENAIRFAEELGLRVTRYDSESDAVA